jgi:hypothetical protein
MKRHIPLFAAATLAVLRVHCYYGPAEVRVRNASEVPFENVFVSFPEQEESYGKLAAGEASAYRVVEKAYRYAYVQVHFDGDTATVQPIDYVGEKPLREGHYTYQLTLIPDADSVLNRVGLELVTDD